MTTTDNENRKKEEGAKKALIWKSAYDTLLPLVSIEIKKMSSKEQLSLITVLGQMLGILDEKGRVKPL